MAYLIGGRRRVRNPIRFGIAFFLVALVSFLLGFSNRTPDPKAHVAEMFREAAGTKPVDSASSGSDPAMDALLRDVMQDMVARARTYQQHAAAFKVDLGQSYTTSSFSSPAARQRSVLAVNGITALDHGMLQQLETLPDRTRLQVAQSHVSESDKKDFLNGVNKSFANSKQLEIQKQADEIEARWRDQTVILYDFALVHSRSIKPQGDQLVISDENVRSKVDDEMKKATELRSDLRNSNLNYGKSRTTIIKPRLDAKGCWARSSELTHPALIERIWTSES